MDAQRQGHHFVKNAIDSVADAQPVFLGLNVNVRSPVSYRLFDKQVDSSDNGRLGDGFGRDARFSNSGGFLKARGDLTELLFDFSADPVGQVYHFLNILEGGKHRLDSLTGQSSQFLYRLEIARVFHSQYERIIADVHRDNGVFAGYRFGNHGDGVRSDALFSQIDKGDSQMQAGEKRQLLRGD